MATFNSMFLTSDQVEMIDKVFIEDFINDHNDREDRVNTVGIWMRNLGTQAEIVPVYAGTFCINPFYLGKDGRVHLSTCSCGGTVIGGNVDRFNHEMSMNNLDGWHTIEHLIPITKEGWEKVKTYIEKKF